MELASPTPLCTTVYLAATDRGVAAVFSCSPAESLHAHPDQHTSNHQKTAHMMPLRLMSLKTDIFHLLLEKVISSICITIAIIAAIVIFIICSQHIFHTSVIGKYVQANYTQDGDIYLFEKITSLKYFCLAQQHI